MRTATTLGAFALGLTVVFAASVRVGHIVGPIGPVGPVASQEHGDTGHADGAGHGGGAQATVPEGLSASLEGFTLRLDTAVLPAGTQSELDLTVLGPDGRPVTAYTATHHKDVHLIVVRRDGSGYQHLHPERDAAGRWSVPITLPAAGSYTVFADTAPAGRAQADGYTVTLTGDLVAGRSSTVTLSVSRDCRPVIDLEPYLGAYGHLVSLRTGDLGYLHTHPDGAPGDGRTAAGGAP